VGIPAADANLDPLLLHFKFGDFLHRQQVQQFLDVGEIPNPPGFRNVPC
jgi:hypothetical protein